MKIFHEDACAACGIFSIQGPGHIGVGVDPDLIRNEEVDHFRIVLPGLQGDYNAVEGVQGERRLDEGDLKKAIIQGNQLLIQGSTPPMLVALLIAPKI